MAIERSIKNCHRVLILNCGKLRMLHILLANAYTHISISLPQTIALLLLLTVHLQRDFYIKKNLKLAYNRYVVT